MHVPPEGSAAPSRQRDGGGGGGHANPRWRGSAEEAVVVVGPKRMSVVDAAPRSRQSEDRLDVRTVRALSKTHLSPLDRRKHSTCLDAPAGWWELGERSAHSQARMPLDPLRGEVMVACSA